MRLPVLFTSLTAAVFVLSSPPAQAQAVFEQSLARDGRTYQSAYSSLESRGGQGQYGSYLQAEPSGIHRYTASGKRLRDGRNVVLSTGAAGNGTRLNNPYRAYRYGSTEIDFDSQGSYSRTPGANGGMNGYGPLGFNTGTRSGSSFN